MGNCVNVWLVGGVMLCVVFFVLFIVCDVFLGWWVVLLVVGIVVFVVVG